MKIFKSAQYFDITKTPIDEHELVLLHQELIIDYLYIPPIFIEKQLEDPNEDT